MQQPRQVWMFEGGDEPAHPARTVADRFETFWRAYPASRRVGKGRALRAFTAAHVTDEELIEILRVLPLQQAGAQWSRGYIPHPTTYLNQRRWLDDPASYAPEPPSVEEIRTAQRIRLNSRTGCPHDTPCESARVCVLRLVQAQRAREGGV